METTDEAEAKARVNEIERLARGGNAPAAAQGELSVEGFVGTAEAPGEWLELRKVARPLAWRDDVSKLRHHFFPRFGARSLQWLSTDDGGREIFAWAVGLKTHNAQRDGKPIASRTVWNIYSSVKVLLEDAVELKRLDRNPLASFRADKYLPERIDKHDGWRETAGFELDQVVSLTSDARLSERRRVWNVLAFMVGGGRTGEIANLRWRDWTESYKCGPGRLVISTSYNTRERVEKGTKTGAKKLIPVHHFAADVLKAWRDGGWQEWMGAKDAPKPEDLIVSRRTGRQCGNHELLEQFHADLDTLKIPRQRQYENRSTFRNLLLRAGAPEFVVNLMTHPSPKQASDFYTRIEMQWPAMCSAILLLDHEAWRPQPEGGITAGVTVHPNDAKKDLESSVLERQRRATYSDSLTTFSAPRMTPIETLSQPHGAALARVQGFHPRATTPDQPSGLPPVTPMLFILAATSLATEVGIACRGLNTSRTASLCVELLQRGAEQAAALDREKKHEPTYLLAPLAACKW